MPVTATDEWADRVAPGLEAPPKRVQIVAAGSDTDDLTYVSRALSIGVDGDVRVTMLDGTTLTIPSGYLAVGFQHSMRVRKVFATLTTASKIAAWS